MLTASLPVNSDGLLRRGNDNDFKWLEDRPSGVFPRLSKHSDPPAGAATEAPGKFQFEQYGLHRLSRQAGSADQFVDLDRRRA